MTQYMLDTNMVSHLVKAHPALTAHLVTLPLGSLCISAITEGELLFGLAKRPDAKRLQEYKNFYGASMYFLGTR